MRAGTLTTKFLTLKETSEKPVKVVLFGEDTNHDFKQNDVMSITDVCRWKKKTTESLSTKQSSKIELG